MIRPALFQQGGSARIYVVCIDCFSQNKLPFGFCNDPFLFAHYGFTSCYFFDFLLTFCFGVQVLPAGLHTVELGRLAPYVAIYWP